MSPQAALASPVFLLYVSLVGGLLLLGGLVLALLKWGLRKHVDHAWRAYCGWLLLAPVAFGCLFLGRAAAIAALTVTALAGFREFARATGLDRDRLMTLFREKGEKALLSALQDQKPVGTISTPGSIAYDLRYARQLPTAEGGRRIILATDRPMGFWEAANNPRSADYPFTLIELRVDKDGKGEGKLSVASKLTLNDNTLVIENYADQPVMLNEVKAQK